MSSENLAGKKCKPCEGGVAPYKAEEAEAQLAQLPDWTLSSSTKWIRKDYVMKNFVAAVDFVNKIAEVAEAEDHHPDLHIKGYRNLTVELSTHAIGGLSENDFILAAKIENLPKELKG